MVCGRQDGLEEGVGGRKEDGGLVVGELVVDSRVGDGTVRLPETEL